MTYPAIQRKAKSNKSKAQQLPKHDKCRGSKYFQTKRRGKTKKRSNKGSKKIKKLSKTASKNIKTLTETTKIPVPSNIPQRKSSWPCKKSRVVLENKDLLTEEEFIEESTEELYTSSS